MLWHRFLVTGDPITSELIEHIVDAVLVPYVAAAPVTAPRRPKTSRPLGSSG